MCVVLQEPELQAHLLEREPHLHQVRHVVDVSQRGLEEVEGGSGPTRRVTHREWTECYEKCVPCPSGTINLNY